MTAVALVVEMDGQTSRDGYGHVHVKGCRNVHDGMSIGVSATFGDARTSFLDATGWDLDDDEDPHYAQCAFTALNT